MNPNMLLEMLNVYMQLNLFSRPRAAEINRQTGFGLFLGIPLTFCHFCFGADYYRKLARKGYPYC